MVTFYNNGSCFRKIFRKPYCIVQLCHHTQHIFDARHSACARFSPARPNTPAPHETQVLPKTQPWPSAGNPSKTTPRRPHNSLRSGNASPHFKFSTGAHTPHCFHDEWRQTISRLPAINNDPYRTARRYVSGLPGGHRRMPPDSGRKLVRYPDIHRAHPRRHLNFVLPSVA